MATLNDLNNTKNDFVRDLVERYDVCSSVANSIWNVLSFDKGEIDENEYISVISSFKK